MRFIFTCGGTAGHINPALAVAGRLRQLMPDCEILFLGAEGNMEMDLVPREGYAKAQSASSSAERMDLRTASVVISTVYVWVRVLT